MLHVMSLKTKASTQQRNINCLFQVNRQNREDSTAGRQGVAYQQAVTSNFPAMLLNSIIVVICLLEGTACL